MYPRTLVGTKQPNNVTSRGATSKHAPAVGYCASGVTAEGLAKNSGRLLFPWMSFTSAMSKTHSKRRLLQNGAWPLISRR